MIKQVRFRAGDKIRVTDDNGFQICMGIVLQTRGYIGWAEFQVMQEGPTEVWVKTFNLNQVGTEVLS